MGSSNGAAWEKPVHTVEISAFAIGKRPVTNAEFRAFRPSHHSVANDNDESPVTDISWEDAVEYCRWLSDQTGRPYRLPSEAEWERAARGGLEQKKYPWGDEAPAVLPAPTADGHRAIDQPDVRAYVATLEEWIIRTLANFNVKGERREDRIGVWVRRPDKGEGFEDKIAAIGIRVRRWVSLHGIAINVEPDLSHFSGIVPCGVSERCYGVTSLADLGLTVTMPELDMALRREFEALFGPVK